MGEITTNYEERCKELEFLIKKLYPTMSDYQKEKVEGIFPELAKSEDEKIKKWIIEHFEECIVAQPSNISYVAYVQDKVLPWLEKQAKQEYSWSEYDEKIRKEIISFLENIGIEEIKKVPRDICEWFAWLEKHKPVVIPKFTIGDTIRRKSGDGTYYTIVDIVNDYYICDNNHSWSISLQDYFELAKQKPIEWSDED